jgi:hypothetical protein
MWVFVVPLFKYTVDTAYFSRGNTSVLYGSILGIHLTTDVFIELPDDGPVRNETHSRH